MSLFIREKQERERESTETGTLLVSVTFGSIPCVYPIRIRLFATTTVSRPSLVRKRVRLSSTKATTTSHLIPAYGRSRCPATNTFPYASIVKSALALNSIGAADMTGFMFLLVYRTHPLIRYSALLDSVALATVKSPMTPAEEFGLIKILLPL